MLRACLGLYYHGRMEELPGAFGSSASLALRLGQTVFSTASLLFMCLDVDFYGYTAFCYLVTVMGLVIPWSITLLVVDAYSVFIKCLPLQRRLVMIIFLGDMILSYLSLAAACSTASVADLLLDADTSYCPQSYVVDINYLLLWPSCLGFFQQHPVCLTSGFSLLCKVYLACC
ncbi:CASP protein [Spatholobus suberectus]|nr:CASP protein [Spatholobus suberectus]